jgi:CHASE2 domain-containing sensor protein
METWIVLWRWLNIALTAVGLFLLLDDIRRRSQLRLRQRFYWQAVALLLVSAGWGTAAALAAGSPLSPSRTTLATVALVYFIISIEQVRRFNRREEKEQREQGNQDCNDGLT